MKKETVSKANDLIKKIDNIENHQQRLIKGDNTEFDEEKIQPKLVFYNAQNFESTNESIPLVIREKLMVEAQDCARRMYKILEKEKAILQKEFNNLKDE
jgi:hypothetical protein